MAITLFWSELRVTVFVVSNFLKGLQDILHYYSFKIFVLQTHLKYYVENKLKQTAEAFDDHHSQTEVHISLIEQLYRMLDKSIRNDWQIRVYLLSKCLVDFRRQQLLFDFWGGRVGDFRKKYNCRLISRGKSLQGYTLYVGTIISCTGKKYCSWWI